MILAKKMNIGENKTDRIRKQGGAKPENKKGRKAGNFWFFWIYALLLEKPERLVPSKKENQQKEIPQESQWYEPMGEKEQRNESVIIDKEGQPKITGTLSILWHNRQLPDGGEILLWNA